MAIVIITPIVMPRQTNVIEVEAVLATPNASAAEYRAEYTIRK